MNHINSHFGKHETNPLGDVPEQSPLAPLEFISTGKLKTEEAVTEVPTTPDTKVEAKFTNESKRSDDVKNSDELNPPATRVVRIIKRKRNVIKDTASDKLNSVLTTKTVKRENTVNEECNSPPTTKVVRIIKRESGEEELKFPLKSKIVQLLPGDIEKLTKKESNSAPTTKVVIERKRSELGHAVDKNPDTISSTRKKEKSCEEINHPADKESDLVQIPTIVDGPRSEPTNKIVKVVRLKRIHFKPAVKAFTKSPTLSNLSQINVSNTVDPGKRQTLTQLKPTTDNSITETNETVPAETQNTNETVLPPYKKSRSSCYQCETEPRIYDRTDPRRHICLFCPIWFPNHIDFENHVQTTHNKDPNYVSCKDFYCYVCERRFDFRTNLNRHMLVHNGTADFLCATCGGSFKTRGRLNSHMKIHDNRTFVCDECGKTFKIFAKLREHLWCHNKNLSFVCRICSKGFKAKRYLKIHMAIHREAKIKCRYCDATFRFSWARRVHERNRHNNAKLEIVKVSYE